MLHAHNFGAASAATEILGIRYKNTANGGARNIFINHGQVSWVTAYHKNFRQTNEAKVIHRFLPREVGELLVWYLWLVLPFWQKLQGIIKGASGVSAAVWGLEMVERRKADTDEGYWGGRPVGWGCIARPRTVAPVWKCVVDNAGFFALGL